MSVGVWFNRELERVESDFGVIEHCRPDPSRGEVGPLCLVSGSWFENILANNPTTATERFSAATATERDGRLFFRLDFPRDPHLLERYELQSSWTCPPRQSYTWERFQAYWRDKPNGYGHPLYVGRWPD